MKDKITVIITIRNRDCSRIINQIKSIRDAGADPSFHIVDYGSNEDFAKQYEVVCNQLHLKYTHLYAEGLPWNKCRAINYGAKVATTPFIVTSDVDMLYEGNPFQWCLDNYSEKSMYHIETFWLPKNGNKSKMKYAGHGNSGGFQFINKKAFDEIGGYDERMVYWGLEDLDWPARLKKIGYTQEWLPEEFKIYHVWHQKSENNFKRPETTTRNTLIYYLENTINPKIKQEEIKLTYDDRPILKKINQNNSYFKLDFSKKDISNYKVSVELLKKIKENTFIKLELGKRYITSKKHLFQRIISFLARKNNLSCNLKINTNFDTFYVLLPLLKKCEVIDYYLNQDLDYVYLLKK